MSEDDEDLMISLEFDDETEIENEEGYPSDDDGELNRIQKEIIANELKYDDLDNSNNMSLSYKRVDIADVQSLRDIDGYPFVFMSKADGPMLSSQCKEQIMILNYVLNYPPSKKRLLSTKNLVPSFSAENIFEKLVHRAEISEEEIDLIEGSRIDLEGTRVDHISFNQVCDFRESAKESGFIEKTVQIGELLVSPVCARYTSSDGKECCEVFWLTVCKTRRNFDLAGHISDIISSQGSEVSGKRKGQVNKDLEKCIELLRKILLYQYKISPNARQYLKEESCVRVDPFDRMMQFGSPDCIDAVCNIYEMFRAIVSSLGEGVTGVEVDGFTVSVHKTGRDPYGFIRSMRAQTTWRKKYVQEQARVADLELKTLAASKEKDEVKRLELLENLGGDLTIFLPHSIGWPCQPDDYDQDNGLPPLSLIMQVDMPGVLSKCSNMLVFTNTTGDLPIRVTADLTEMLYKPTSADTVKLPKGMLMPTPESLTEFDRIQKFMIGENSLDAFCSAGYLSKQLNRMKSVLAATVDPVQKILLYNEYIACCGRQVTSTILNGNLHSSSTFFAAQYIEAAKDTACQDLRNLVGIVMSELDSTDAFSMPMDAPWADNTESLLFWKRTSPSTFVENNFCVEALLQRHNMEFFLLTPQNLKIANEVALSGLMFRLGQGNGFTYIGMPTVVADTACKLKVRMNFNGGDITETRKRPSAGLDFVREVGDTRRISYQSYLAGWTQIQDDQKVTQLKRTTEAGVQTGFVLFVNGDVEKMPENELARDCVMPEGPPDDMKIMCAMLTAIPRDGDNNSELWTTVDKDKTNVRSKAFMKLIQGFSLYLCLLAKNYFYESKTESRFLDLTIVCNIMYSSGPPDLAGVYRKLDVAPDAMEAAEDSHDSGSLGRPNLGCSTGTRSKKKGDKPRDADQKKWAPLHYFVPAIAGSSVAMSNKLGSWTMNINYAFKSLSDHLYHFSCSRLSCLISEYDENNASRYFESYLCRCVADTVYKTTFSEMLGNDTTDAAVFNAIRRLSYNAVDISLLPSLLDRVHQRIIQYEPLLAAATIGLCIDVPVVSILTIKQFLDGKYIDDRDEYQVLRKFCNACWTNKMFLNKDSVLGDAGSFGARPIPYITSKGDWSDANSVLREKIFTGNDRKAQSEIIPPLCKKLFDKNQKALNTSAFCKSHHSFVLCIKSLFVGFDLRGFLGGMSKYPDSKFLLESLDLNFASNFQSSFVEPESLNVDPVACMGRVDIDIYCIGVRIWDILLFFALMKRPRRDIALIEDFSSSLTEHLISTLPSTIFPYNIVPANKVDSITNKQRTFEFSYDRVHGNIIRNKNMSIGTDNARIECPGFCRSGVLEDEMHMSNLVMICNDIKCEIKDFPIDNWPISLTMSYGFSYPFRRFRNAITWKAASGIVGDMGNVMEHLDQICVFMHPSRNSVMLFSMTKEPLVEELESSDWTPSVKMIKEFATSNMGDETIFSAQCMDHIQGIIFGAGFGPMPRYERSSVPVMYGDNISCIVPHQLGLHGCMHSQTKTCYYCPHNPFYEVLQDSNKITHRMDPLEATEHVIPIGTLLLLDMRCTDFTKLVNPSQIPRRGSYKRKRVCLMYDSSGVPIDASGDSALVGEEDEFISLFMQVRVDIPRNLTPVQGKIFVSLRVRYEVSRSTDDIRSIYVSPEHLRVPVEGETCRANDCILI